MRARSPRSRPTGRYAEVGLDLKTKVKITDQQRGIQALCAGLQEGEGQDARRVLRPHGLNRKYATGSFPKSARKRRRSPLPEGLRRTADRAESPSTPTT